MIVGLVGKKGSGKDTVAAYLMKEYEFQRKAFADPLKKSVAALLDIPFSEIDKLKLDQDIHITLHRNYTINFSDKPKVTHEQSIPITSFSFREFLQRYGTESHRDIFGPDFWVDQTLPVGGYYQSRKIVITDCRFNNEADRIKSLGGKVVLVTRPELKATDEHQSEKELESIVPNHILKNNGSIEDLYKGIEELLLVL